ncbi:putative Serine/threonine-protein kinase PBS1 [Corchorus olitorius]|uniref:Serine/threonine-protein kinase PBS1 n=1 Tax=Corchorus olitorius TaxID=93759 RepID=A0A1R3KW01_9ROSI|nr:putative Serine/threonine-protein kinase PBS1 [Corchorus olitorius]
MGHVAIISMAQVLMIPLPWKQRLEICIDLGLSKIHSLDNKKALERIDSLVKGTWGYLDLEKVLDLKLNEGQVNLAHWARSCATKGTIHEIIDPYLRGKIAPECFKIFVRIALSCISEMGNNRPDIGEVEATLELALELQIEADSEMEGIHPVRISETNAGNYREQKV